MFSYITFLLYIYMFSERSLLRGQSTKEKRENQTRPTAVLATTLLQRVKLPLIAFN